jgi:hypothetical protein
VAPPRPDHPTAVIGGGAGDLTRQTVATRDVGGLEECLVRGEALPRPSFCRAEEKE